MFKGLDKNNLHHAYLIEGNRDEIMPEILKFVEDMEVTHIQSDSFKIDDARNLKSYEFLKAGERKKAFVISANNILLEAQNALLKMFEEPIPDTHFFLVVPDKGALLKTFVSRFYSISARQNLATETRAAEKFMAMPLSKRIDFIKELLAEEDEEEGTVILDSARARALNFLNEIETLLHDKTTDPKIFHHIFKAREFLRMPGSSAKSLMESVALML